MLLGAGVAVLALLAAAAAGYFLFDVGRDAGDVADDGGEQVAAAPTADGSDSSTGESNVEGVRRLLTGIGYGNVEVTEAGGTLVLSGEVETDAARAAVLTAAASQADGLQINADDLGVAPETQTVDVEGEPVSPSPAAPMASSVADPLQRLQIDLQRTLAASPLIFQPGTSTIAAWHTEILDRIGQRLLASPGIAINVVGYTDSSGSTTTNQALSEQRANSVRDYLVGLGLDPGLVRIEARGESDATDRRDISYLERRVEVEVVAVSDSPPAPLPLDVGIIVPSPATDLAFSQAMVDAMNVLNEERGGLSLTVSENMFDVDMARDRASEYADGGANVIILHGAQYLQLVDDLAQASPNVVFVVGPGPFETPLPNVFVYTVAAEQGAYVLGDLAASLSTSKTIGIVGPVPAPEPQFFVEGFRLGAEQQGATVIADYVGSFNDVDAARAMATDHVAAGADVLTGTAQLVTGSIEVADQEGLFWFANQANQTSLAPDTVVASQVYHFEVAIREILAEIDADAPTGGSFPLTLGNGGMLLEFNPNFPLSPELRDRADALLLEVTAGSITVDVELQ